MSDDNTLREQDLLFRWQGIASKLTDDQKTQIGLAYLSSILGFNEQGQKEYAKGNCFVFLDVHEAILSSNDEHSPSKIISFWNKVAKIRPGLHSIGDSKFLSSSGNIRNIVRFLRTLHLKSGEDKNKTLEMLDYSFNALFLELNG